MRSIVLGLALLLASPSPAHASSCGAFQQIEDAGLYNGDNARFWEDFAELQAKGDPSESQVAALIAKHKGGTPASASAAPTTGAPTPSPRASLVGNQQIRLHHDAEKGLAKAPPQVQEKFDDLLRIVEQKGPNAAIHELKTKGWDYHLIHERGMYAVKLNGGYRALLEVKDGVMNIRDIGQHIYRH